MVLEIQDFPELDREEMGEKRDRGHLVEKKESPKEERDLQAINAGEGVEKREPSYIVGGNVDWYSHYAEQYGGCLVVKLKLSGREFG